MRGVAAGAFNKSYIAKYDRFRGVDLSSDGVGIDKTRSPHAPNMICVDGTPQKRPGWRTLIEFPKENGEAVPVNGIFSCCMGGVEHVVVHVGTKIYRVLDDAATLLIENINSHKSCAVYSAGALYIFTGGEYLIYDGSACRGVAGRTPIVTIGRLAEGGGSAFEPINLLSAATTDSFSISKDVFAQSPTYFTSIVGADELNEGEGNPVEVSVLLKGNVWETRTEIEFYGEEGFEESYFQTGEVNGVLTVTIGSLWQGALEDEMLFIDGEDNLRITGYKTRDGDADRVNKIKSAILYNGFIFGCGAERGTDYRSGFDDPTYWPADGYDNVGSTDTDIVGYLRVGEYLAVVKEENHREASVYFRRDVADDEGGPMFTKQQAISGIGAVSRHGFASLCGDPLFLSRHGIFAVGANAVTGEHRAENRSVFVDCAIKAQRGLENAVCAVWEGLYILCVNANAYILDSTQHRPYSHSSQAQVYECYHWNSIPAVVLHSSGGDLFFGTADGRLCRFNSDIEGSLKYSDDGEAIDASWSTAVDDDGNFAEKKSMTRSGTALLAKPFCRSSAEVLVRSERELCAFAAALGGFFDFGDIVFDDKFSFETSDTPRVLPVRCGLRRYHTLQITVRNAVVNEGFGIFGIVKRFYRCGEVR
jgi:hypothetical protein